MTTSVWQYEIGVNANGIERRQQLTKALYTLTNTLASEISYLDGDGKVLVMCR